jgi:hypothetical protein
VTGPFPLSRAVVGFNELCNGGNAPKEGETVSLDVPAALLERAEAGPVDDAAFIDCVRGSLRYAWSVVSIEADRLHAGAEVFVDHSTPPPSEQERGQLLRAFGSDALQRHIGVVLAFQNCHRVAAFRRGSAGGLDHRAFTSSGCRK